MQRFIFFLLLVLLPINLAKHFAIPHSYTGGVLVDYLIPTLYLTDILVLALLGLWGMEVLSKKGGIGSLGGIGRVITALVFLLPLVWGVLGARNQPAAIYRAVKLVEYALFAVYIRTHFSFKKDWLKIVTALAIGVGLESILAIGQWFKQGSVFGYWFLGEPIFNAYLPGIAKASLGGALRVRPYGTFPHPNVLGGYLAVVLVWLVSSLKKGQRWLSPVVGGGLAALILSFSRTAWLAWGLGLVMLFVFKFQGKRRQAFIGGLVLGGLGLGGSVVLKSGVTQSLSWMRRAELGEVAIRMIKTYPLLGVGLNNFTIRLREFGTLSGLVWFLQPVHNTFLLVAAELGLVGLGVYGGLLGKVVVKARKNPLLLLSLVQILFISLFDHYFWTLQQTALLFWLVIGLVNKG